MFYNDLTPLTCGESIKRWAKILRIITIVFAAIGIDASFVLLCFGLWLIALIILSSVAIICLSGFVSSVILWGCGAIVDNTHATVMAIGRLSSAIQPSNPSTDSNSSAKVTPQPDSNVAKPTATQKSTQPQSKTPPEAVTPKSITIDEDATLIKNLEFYNNMDLVDFVIPNNITNIGNSAFAHCENLTSITIPESVSCIGGLAFKACKNLNNITFKGTIDQWNAINKEEHWNFRVPATEVVCSDGTVSLN